MNNIRIVDSRMGRGKTSAAAAYMAHNKDTKRFLYITPYLTEVDRICESCDFDQADGDSKSKLIDLKRMLHQKKNIAATHSLYYLMDDDALEVAKKNNYTLIIDESIDVISKVPVSSKDMDLIHDTLATVDDEGFVHWIDSEYAGKFSGYKEMADAGSLIALDTSLICIMRPQMLTAFDEIIMMTYLFGGQSQKAYLDFFGFDYQICGIDDSDGFKFTDSPDAPPPIDYTKLISIVDDPRMNEIGDNKYALSANWYQKHKRNSKEMRQLRNNMNTFFRRKSSSKTREQLWTCFKTDASKLIGDDGRHASSFLQLAARATNEYRDRYSMAYMVNRFVDPNVIKFFATRGITIDADEYALGEMLQWIWRGRIRDNKPIELYIPSSRMRSLLIDWMERNSKGE